jgi:hypothetical protein
MSTATISTATTPHWDGIDRRTGELPKAPLFGELLVESSWRPADLVPAATEGWLRSAGYVKDRRTK